MIYLFVGLHIYALPCNSKLHMSDDNYKTYFILSRGIRCFVFISFLYYLLMLLTTDMNLTNHTEKHVFSGIKLCPTSDSHKMTVPCVPLFDLRYNKSRSVFKISVIHANHAHLLKIR